MSNRPVALITGASSGIGLAFAEALGKKKHDLVLVARRKERLDALAARLARDAGVRSEVLVADLASDAGRDAVVARAAKGDLALVVNNAGVSRYAPYAQVEPKFVDEVIRLHVDGPAKIARAALPAMAERGSGAVINIASLLALSGTLPPIPLPFRATYAAAKSFLVTFSQTLSHEVASKGVKVQVCLPGIVESEFHDDMGDAKHRLPPGMKPADVVTASLAALEKGDVVCIPGLEDPALFEKVGEAQRAVLQASNRPQLAARWTK